MPWAGASRRWSSARAGREARFDGSDRRRRQNSLEALLRFGEATLADEVKHSRVEGRLPIKALGRPSQTTEAMALRGEHVDEDDVLGAELLGVGAPEPGGQGRAVATRGEGDQQRSLAQAC